MARDREAQIKVFYVIEVSWSLPLGAHLPDAESTARETLHVFRQAPCEVIVDRLAIDGRQPTHPAPVQSTGVAG